MPVWSSFEPSEQPMCIYVLTEPVVYLAEHSVDRKRLQMSGMMPDCGKQEINRVVGTQ